MEEMYNLDYLIMPDKIEWEEINPSYGKVAISSLERGFATTLGNSLRRVLLFCIPGTAITSVKIDGVQHEFSTIPGVVEDVPQIIANLKQTIIKFFDEEAKKDELILEVEEKGEVRAGDIKTDKNVEILNPHLHIATLDKKKKLKIVMQVEKGKSYVPVKKSAAHDMPIGSIQVDALYSPVKKVNFKVEHTLLGERTDYEKLVLDIWTDGTIAPDEALEYAADVLIKHYQLIITGSKNKESKEEIVEEILEEGAEEKKGLLSKNIAEFDLSVRSMNCLKAAKIKTLGDLVKKTEEEMMQFKNFGKKSLDELRELLDKKGLSFKESQ